METWATLKEYFYKNQIRPKIMHCCHIWAGAIKSFLSSYDRIQKHIHSLVGNDLFSAPTAPFQQAQYQNFTTSNANDLTS